MEFIFVRGIGTIGGPNANILADIANQLGAQICFDKKSVRKEDIPRIRHLQKKGVLFAVAEGQKEDWRSLGLQFDISLEEAEIRASIIVDCAEKAFKERKAKYENLTNLKLCIAQGSEKGFGPPFAYGIIPTKNGKFKWVVSCNSHALASLIFAIAMSNGKRPPQNLLFGDFVISRRSTDVKQEKMNASPKVDVHGNQKSGTHQALDVSALFEFGLGCNPLPIFSSTQKLPSQFMHVTRFLLELDEVITNEEVVERIKANKMMAITQQLSTGAVYDLGKDLQGYMGRIMNHSVIPIDTIHVSSSGKIVRGWAFTPQDGNSILSTIYLILQHLGKEDMMKNFLCEPYIFKEM